MTTIWPSPTVCLGRYLLSPIEPLPGAFRREKLPVRSPRNNSPPRCRNERLNGGKKELWLQSRRLSRQTLDLSHGTIFFPVCPLYQFITAVSMACGASEEQPMERFSPWPSLSLLDECFNVPIDSSVLAYSLAWSHICLSSVMGGTWCTWRNSLCLARPISSSCVNSKKITKNKLWNVKLQYRSTAAYKTQRRIRSNTLK